MTSHKLVESEVEARCGYRTPTRPETAYKHTEIEAEDNMEIHLDASNSVFEAKDGIKTEKYLGKWTMVYDEGVEINIKNFSFLTYFKYRGNL